MVIIHQESVRIGVALFVAIAAVLSLLLSAALAMYGGGGFLLQKQAVLRVL